MKRHVTLRIVRALELSDEELQATFNAEPGILRAIFRDKLDDGEIYLGSEGCEGFDPLTGCPGHNY